MHLTIKTIKLPAIEDIKSTCRNVNLNSKESSIGEK